MSLFFIQYSALLSGIGFDFFPWSETDPIFLLGVFYAIPIFLVIGGVLLWIQKKIQTIKINALMPILFIGCEVILLFTIDRAPRFCYISSWIVIVISFITVIATTIISLKNMKQIT